jgi:hypothetical protein
VQRDRDEEVGAGKDLAAGTVHPAPERRRHVGAVAMLQSEHETPAVFVVTQDRARLIPGRALARASAAQRIFSHRMRKRHTAQHAPRRREEADPVPAPAAQRIRLVDELAAGQAARRQHAIDDGSAEPP